MLHKNLNRMAGTTERALSMPVACKTTQNQSTKLPGYTAGRRGLLWPVLVFAFLLCFQTAFAAGAPQVTSSNRFLFIIDGSATMKPFDKVARDTLFDLIYSGVRGRMTNGDTYGVWIAGEQNDTSFPMEVWKSKHAVETAAKAALYVKERGFKGRSRLDVALTDAVRVVKNVEDLTIILISNGETPITGTPFDTEINQKFRDLAPSMKKAKVTVNTTLVAQDGEFVAWAANAPEFVIEVPYVVAKPKKPKAEPIVAAEAPAPAPIKSAPEVKPANVKPTNVVVQKPRASSPIVITKETVARDRRSFQAMTDAAYSNDVPELVATNETTAPTVTNPSLMVATITSAPIATTTSVMGQANQAEKTIVVPQTNPATVATVTKPEATNAAAVAASKVEPPSKPLAASATNEAPAGASFHPMLWAAFGAGLALAGVLAVYFVVRSRRVEPSLISEALAQERFSRQSNSART
jgi:hypothetical protein